MKIMEKENTKKLLLKRNLKNTSDRITSNNLDLY